MTGTTGTAWLLGLVLGALDGFLGFEFPMLGLVLAGVAATLFVANRRGLAGIGGLLLAAGTIWAVVLVNSALSCAAFDAAPNQECHMAGDITPFVVGAGVAAAVGLGLSVLARWGQARP